MLQLKSIYKAYTTGDFTQVALNNVSITFRDNEFVAVLGPSGSGKTTMLNIVGGLDHYDYGDLVIDGISTKEYKDRDWDAYRNNRIGFVFQSYNLIPHQTVLANVELALTLSGVSRDERRKRAIDALDKVGLKDHINKKPSQLSGGQMQRVAIARALINDPEILLADEPTGALDSKTSVQIMDLLTEIASDRLVVMVTHNPELAEQYATRIVNLADGVITSDSQPYDPATEPDAAKAKPSRRTSMSFLTALSLSFNNLMTKKGRTIMTAFAGSIGIIGIAAILALANGVNQYIVSVEEETLSEYPLQINSTGFDMTALMSMSGSSAAASSDGSKASGEVGETKTITKMFSSIGSNDLASLKEYLDSGQTDINKYAKTIQYSYNVEPQIYDADTSNGVHQINPDTSLTSLGISSDSSSSSIMSMSMNTNMFSELVDDTTLYENQYDVKAGHWPEAYNECVLVLSKSGKVSDYLLYALGMRDRDELKSMVKQFANDEEVTVSEDTMTLNYSDFMNKEMKLLYSTDYYEYDSAYDVWKNKNDNEEYMKNLVANAENIKIVGVVQPKADSKASSLSTGIYYTSALTKHIIEKSSGTQIVKDQLADKNKDVFSGKGFDDESNASSSFDMSSLFTIDGNAISAAFTIDESKITEGIDLTGTSSMSQSTSGMDEKMFENYTKMYMESQNKALLNAGESLSQIAPTLITKFLNSDAWINLPDADKMNQEKVAAAFKTWVETDQAAQALLAPVIQQYGTETTTAFVAILGKAVSDVTSAMAAQMSQMMTETVTKMASNMANAMSIDTSAFQNAFKMNMSSEDLTELMTSMMKTSSNSYDNNLKKLGYADLAKPSGIDVYPIDFDSKEKIVEILDGYNQKQKDAGEDDKVITYTDIVGTMMASVTTIIDMISAVLIAFVAISLVVSSIMIGVITYISVLERKKEIGILRSIGASKGNIRTVFNAETIIVGFIAGVLGIAITLIGCIPANLIVDAIFDVPNVAILPWNAAVILVCISVFLTFIGGLIPAGSASRKDPVEALRSE